MTRTVVTPETLMAVKLTGEWSEVDCFHEEWVYDQNREPWVMKVGGHGRMFGNKHVIVLINRCGEYHPQWRLYIDGHFTKCLETILGVCSGCDAELHAEEYLKSLK